MKSFISLSIFLAIAFIAWWTITEDFNDDDQSALTKSKQYIEIFMNEFEITAMNESGTPNYILKGLYLERYNDADETLVQQPVFHILQKNNQWKIDANNAIINDINETLLLKDNVVMQQQNIEPSITIRTQKLMINTKKQTAKTKERVEITHGGSLMTSNGMIFNNLTSELELSSKVSGYYLPNDQDI